MELQFLSSLIEDHAPYKHLLALLENRAGAVVQLEGVAISAKSMILSHLREQTKRPLAIISYTDDQAERITSDLLMFGVPRAEIVMLPQTAQTLLYTEGAPDYAIIGQRIDALRRMANGTATVYALGPGAPAKK